MGIEWRFSADRTGERCTTKHLDPRKIKVQVTAVARGGVSVSRTHRRLDILEINNLHLDHAP